MNKLGPLASNIRLVKRVSTDPFAGARAKKAERKRESADISIKLPAPVYDALVAAAKRRENMPPAALAVGLLGAALMRGNLDEMLNRWCGYNLAISARTQSQRTPKRTTENPGESLEGVKPENALSVGTG
jgi:hypothetical protein